MPYDLFLLHFISEFKKRESEMSIIQSQNDAWSMWHELMLLWFEIGYTQQQKWNGLVKCQKDNQICWIYSKQYVSQSLREAKRDQQGGDNRTGSKNMGSRSDASTVAVARSNAI